MSLSINPSFYGRNTTTWEAGIVEMLTAEPQSALQAVLEVPGDKSISHRLALLGSMAEGTTRIHRFLMAEDTLATLRCLRQCGVAVEDKGSGEIVIHGRGMIGWHPPAEVLDAGNSGTTLRLLLGVLASQPFEISLTGDASLRRRPMDRVALPLSRMGAEVAGQGVRCLPPVYVQGGTLRAIDYRPPMASAQVKTAVLLAGLSAVGKTTVIEPTPSRDHTERLLPQFGAELSVQGTHITVRGPARLRGGEFTVPGDFSSAAFLLAAGAMVPGSEVTVRSVGVNPTRTGFLQVLEDMGAEIRLSHQQELGGEPVADVTVRHRPLRGVQVAGSIIPRLIDELPVLAVVACFAEGMTEIRDAQELRVKETDRISMMVGLLSALGAQVEERPDGMRLWGPSRLRGGRVEAEDDHRIAMAMVVAGWGAEAPVEILGVDSIRTSFPDFFELHRRLQAPS